MRSVYPSSGIIEPGALVNIQADTDDRMATAGIHTLISIFSRGLKF